MTCASCANRIERKLNKVPGVTATVNYATEKAKVSYADGRRHRRPGRGRRGGRVRRQAARTARRPPTRSRGVADDPARRCGSGCSSRRVLTVPVVAMAMVPALQFTNWQWLSLTLAAPVVVWGALAVPPCRLGQPAARHLDDGHARLDGHARGVRLVALRAVLRYGRRARDDAPVRADRPAQRRRRATSTSRPLPGSPRSSSPAGTSRRGPSGGPVPRCAPCSSWAPRTSRSLRDGVETPGRRSSELAVGDRFVVRPGEKVATDGVVEEGSSAVDASMLTGESVPVEVGRRGRRRRRDRQRRRAARRARHPGRRRTPSSPRWPGWSRTRRTARPRCSGWPTGSPGVFVPVVIALAVGHPRLLARHRRGRSRRRSPPRSRC